MIEIKLSQGAKPGHGGILPANKVTPEIAEARGIPVWRECDSPSRHSAFDTPVELLQFVKKLRELGASEVHIRISSPPVKFPCFYGIDFSSRGELIAAQHNLAEITRKLDVDSLHYLSIDGLLGSVSQPRHYCMACFTGEYPVPCDDCGGKFSLESACAAR